VKSCSDFVKEFEPKLNIADECATKEEINARISEHVVEIYYKNFYFDTKVLDQLAIKSYSKYMYKPLVQNLG